MKSSLVFKLIVTWSEFTIEFAFTSTASSRAINPNLKQVDLLNSGSMDFNPSDGVVSSTTKKSLKMVQPLHSNSWVALVITNLAENLFLSPLFNFIGLIADVFSFGVSFISGEDSQVSELSDKLGCMILLLLSLAFLYYTLTNDGGIGLFIGDLKKYIKKWREAREFKAMALSCISESRYDKPAGYEPRRPNQTTKQRQRRKNTDKHVSPRRCQSSGKFSD
ncbi:uncharacterized protein LOC111052685 isoform X2 [Nilaparvata lugens]|uniref:uncharacterized protein LOC111052685 isoform X2 n=1 Tax=Nilaparvata lugens TaxID=108931 RepID=UPI00193D44F5|nr:uncharacterized protein LOC111052685 isoform X2 [Nilaparvata lugens]